MRATPRLPALALSLSLSLLGGCVESEMKASLRADGSGALATSAKFTEKFSHAIWRLRAIDPTGEVAAEFEKNLPKEPGEALRKELAGQGLRVKEMGFVLKEREMSSKASFDFDRVSALAGLSRLQGVMPEGQGRFELRLTRDADGSAPWDSPSTRGAGGPAPAATRNRRRSPGRRRKRRRTGPWTPRRRRRRRRSRRNSPPSSGT